VITSFGGGGRFDNGRVVGRSSIIDRGAVSRILERLTCHFVRSGRGLKPMVAEPVGDVVTHPSSQKMTFQPLLLLALPPASLQRFAL